jgi:hypothetical protein
VQILNGNRDVFRECAIGAEDTHHGPIRAVRTQIAPARSAGAAAKVDLADDPFADEPRWSFDDAANELVTRHSLESHVAFENLQIGRTDAGEVNSDNSGLASGVTGLTYSARPGIRIGGFMPQLSSVPHKSAHCDT